MKKHGDKIKAMILTEGVAMWRLDPAYVNCRRIGRQLGITHSAILYHYGTSANLKDAVAAEAVSVGDPVVVPMLIAAKHPAVANLPGVERDRYLAGC